MSNENKSEQKHSPLPWFACDFGPFINIQDGPKYEDKNLLSANVDDMVTEEKIQANAAFIIEACNNYYSLKEERDNLKVDCESYKLTIDLEQQEVNSLQEENIRANTELMNLKFEYHKKCDELQQRIEQLEGENANTLQVLIVALRYVDRLDVGSVSVQDRELFESALKQGIEDNG